MSEEILLDQLNNEELSEIFEQQPISSKIIELIKIEGKKQGLQSLQEHAFGIYWQRRIKLIKCVSEEDIENVLLHRNLCTADITLGELAKKCKLSKTQCERLKTVVCKDEWAFKQIVARLIVYEIQMGPIEIQNLNIKISNLIDLKATWAIIEILKYCPDIVLQELKKNMREKKVLTKSNRNYILQEIDRLNRFSK